MEDAAGRDRQEGVTEERLHGARRALESLADAIDQLEVNLPNRDEISTAADRGYFRPVEEEVLLDWFARFLTVRAGLWEVLGDMSQSVGGGVRRIRHLWEWRCFVIGYSAACLIVRMDRLVLDMVADHTVTQRKLNEGSALHRIPRKQYTAIFESFTDARKASRLESAMRFARRQRRRLLGMASDPVVGGLVQSLAVRERVLDPSRGHYLRRVLEYIDHSIRRRGASTGQQSLFAALEASGRVVSELRDRWTPCRVDDSIRGRIAQLLRPGDVLVTRHERAVTNLFLPGYWPHAALYVGSEEDRSRLGVEIDGERAARWRGDRRVLEALKDGVLFRPLEETLAVDAVAVIRPQLRGAELAGGLARAVMHEGKLYNFDFDFFRSDRLVCTEVVYRAFDGLGPISIPLQERTGRPTLSAEDLLELAVDGRGFDPVAVFGPPECGERLVEGSEATDVIRCSLSH